MIRKCVSILTLSCSLLVGCATTQNYKVAVDGWRGQKLSTLLSVWGYPDHIEHLDRNRKVYVYASEDRGSFPVMQTPGFTDIEVNQGQTRIYSQPSLISGGGEYDFKCKTWFEIGKHKRIRQVRFRGNGCTIGAREVMELQPPTSKLD